MQVKVSMTSSRDGEITASRVKSGSVLAHERHRTGQNTSVAPIGINLRWVKQSSSKLDSTG
jgi:hypothetical protein